MKIHFRCKMYSLTVTYSLIGILRNYSGVLAEILGPLTTAHKHL